MRRCSFNINAKASYLSIALQYQIWKLNTESFLKNCKNFKALVTPIYKSFVVISSYQSINLKGK